MIQAVSVSVPGPDDPDGAEAGVGGIGKLHPGGQAAAQVVQELTGNALARDDHRYARRVRGYADGLNLAGIRRVLALQEETRRLQTELARLRALASEQP
jgi:hypothetical protein